MRHLPFVLFVLLIGATTGSAQTAPSYRLPIGDTLRFAERTEVVVRVGDPRGRVEGRFDHAATIGVVRISPTEVHGWFDSVYLRQMGPMAQGSEPETTPLIDEPFLLEFPADGRVRLVTPPSIPDEIAELTDLTREFNDFFITLPGRALTPGVEWADTMTVTGARRSSDTFQSHQVRRYRVVRDTMVGKTAAFLIEVVGEERIEGSGPMAEAPHITASTVLEGGDTGFAVFSPATGRP